MSFGMIFLLVVPIAIKSAQNPRTYSQAAFRFLQTAAYGSRGVALHKQKEALALVERAYLVSEEERAQDKVRIAALKHEFKDDGAFLMTISRREKTVKKAADRRTKVVCNEIIEFREEVAQQRLTDKRFLTMTLEDKKQRILELNEREWSRKFSSFEDHFAFSKAYADDREKEALLADVLCQDPLFSEVLATSDEACATRKKYKTIKPSFPSEQEQQAMIMKKEEEERKERERDRALSKEVRCAAGKFYLGIFSLPVFLAVMDTVH